MADGGRAAALGLSEVFAFSSPDFEAVPAMSSLRWTERDLARIQAQLVRAPPQKPAKYFNQPVMIDGKRFASKLEGRCYEELKLRKVCGEVLWFIFQPRFPLEGEVVYVADFLAVLNTGGVEVIDAKGKLTASCKNKLRQVKARYGFDVKLWTGK